MLTNYCVIFFMRWIFFLLATFSVANAFSVYNEAAFYCAAPTPSPYHHVHLLTRIAIQEFENNEIDKSIRFYTPTEVYIEFPEPDTEYYDFKKNVWLINTMNLVSSPTSMEVEKEDPQFKHGINPYSLILTQTFKYERVLKLNDRHLNIKISNNFNDNVIQISSISGSQGAYELSFDGSYFEIFKGKTYDVYCWILPLI